MAKRTSLILIILAAIIIVATAAGIITDYWWFDALGHATLFLVGFKARIALFLVAALLFFVFLMGNLLIAARLKKTGYLGAKLGLGALLALVVGFFSQTQWLDVLAYLNAQPFGLTDPIFSREVSFYVFTLPVLHFLWAFAITTVVLTLIVVALDYLQGVLAKLFRPQVVEEQPDVKKVWRTLKGKAAAHLALLASLAFLLVAWRHYLARYGIMYSDSGIVVGAGYTDVHIYLPVMTILALLAVIVAILFIAWLKFAKRLRKRHVIAAALALYVLVAFVGPTLVPAIVQGLVVDPNEFNLEEPYIEHNINFTRTAYGVERVEERDFTPEPLTREKLDAAPETVDNIRLLDWRPLTQTYKQTQEIRLYYDLSGIDVDRYVIDRGTGPALTQVMLAPRELDQDQIAENAKTWVNLHMIYTHGYGAVVSPVNTVTDDGLPDYLVKDIPPATDVERLAITEPRIYYGEKENRYVLVNTETPEFDFPQGSENAYTHYSGTGGVPLDSFWSRLLMAIRFRDVKILLSGDVTGESRILYDRHIQRRISTLAPFLKLDGDPYVVIHEGRLVWIQDAYTTTSRFPYSERSGDVNYVRNAVKAVVDAYDGSVTFYVADEEPLIETYRRVFPDTFKALSAMPPGLQEHIRYPQDLFEVQSRIYSVYHMESPNVFYNKEDAWEVPNEIYGTGQRITMEPYYVIMDLPGDAAGAEFIMMTPFTPIRKDNMISWFAARSDAERYGELVLYQFPKDQLVYGPSQIEAKIDQDSEISQQLTLWSQRGSRVTRGNLLVIPIDSSLLYVEPLYLQAETGQLPQLKRVIVSDGERVVMEETLGEALDALFGRSQEEPEAGDLLEQATSHYEAIEEAMRDGDWAAIGENLEKLGEALERLSTE